MAPYPTTSEISQVFSHLAKGDYDGFWAHVSPTVEWKVMGTHPLSGTWHSVEDFKRDTFGRLNPVMTAQVQPKVVNVVGGGEQEWSCVELEFDGTFKDGQSYDQKYCWILRWNKEGKVVQVRAYLDGVIIQNGLEANEKLLKEEKT